MSAQSAGQRLTSSINAMMWVRGFAADYDEWGALAGQEWDFTHVAEYFERIEHGPLVFSHQPPSVLIGEKAADLIRA